MCKIFGRGVYVNRTCPNKGQKMSHEATNWAIKQRGLKPPAKIVLWHLADRFHPDNGCFPSQSTLAYDCEMSRASLNNQLDILESDGFIRREKRLDRATNRQKSTMYFLNFEREPCPEFGHGAVSKKDQKPCPKNSQSRVQNLDTNLVSNKPVREPVTTPREILLAYTPAEAVDSFLEYRKKHKAKALTVTGAKRLASTLSQISNSGGDPADALGMAEERGWASVQQDWYFNSKGTSNGRTNHNNNPADDPTLRSIARQATSF